MKPWRFTGKLLSGQLDFDADVVADAIIALNQNPGLIGAPGGVTLRKLTDDESINESIEAFPHYHLPWLMNASLAKASKIEYLDRVLNNMNREDAELIVKAVQGRLEFEAGALSTYAGNREVIIGKMSVLVATGGIATAFAEAPKVEEPSQPQIEETSTADEAVEPAKDEEPQYPEGYAEHAVENLDKEFPPQGDELKTEEAADQPASEENVEEAAEQPKRRGGRRRAE